MYKCAETRDRTGDFQIFSLTLFQLIYRSIDFPSKHNSIRRNSKHTCVPAGKRSLDRLFHYCKRNGCKANHIQHLDIGVIRRPGGRAARQGNKAGQQATFIHCCDCRQSYSRVPVLSCNFLSQAHYSMNSMCMCSCARPFVRAVIGLCPQGSESPRRRINCCSMGSRLSFPVHEHNQSFGTPNRSTDGHTGLASGVRIACCITES